MISFFDASDVKSGHFIFCCLFLVVLNCELRTSLVAQMVKHLPAMQKTWVRSLGWEDPLEKETAIHPSILA